MATVHPPRAAPPPIARPQFALLPRSRADAVALDDSESVAESCPHPHRAAATDSSSYGGSSCCHEEEMEDDDDGCSSCVEGDECSYYQQLQEAADDEGGKKAGSRAWWEQLAPAFPLPAAPQTQEATAEEDPKRAAERQEEDRKFWEDCLASGYP
ncbi:uncharacterized protein LOC133892859 [Phragmites australis]|uniref:uncharacterized protein LOC133892859 n=1 Tax=Phragmites australis TaxID=29695 RepID=UPI002D793C5D|nr:uncharacterized protein LOC133892859 [Phragmites australis]